MKRTSITIGILLVALMVIAGTVLAHPTNFRAHLSQAPGAETNGQGQAKFQLNHDELGFVFAMSRLEGDALAAHIHISAAPGGNGPPVISLCGAFGPPPIPVAECGGPGHPAKGSATLSEALTADLMAAIAQNRAYINVHTTAFGPAEIRGQIEINP
jgi:hypothetical protein